MNLLRKLSFSLVFVLAVVTWFRRGNFTLGLDQSYYKN